MEKPPSTLAKPISTQASSLPPTPVINPQPSASFENARSSKVKPGNKTVEYRDYLKDLAKKEHVSKMENYRLKKLLLQTKLDIAQLKKRKLENELSSNQNKDCVWQPSGELIITLYRPSVPTAID